MKELNKDEALEAFNEGKILFLQITNQPKICIKVHRSSFKHDTLIQSNKDIVNHIFANTLKIFSDGKPKKR